MSGEWTALKPRLTAEPPDEAAWKETFRDFYHARLQIRYLLPIQALVAGESDTKRGEGFMVVAVLCTLVEFLESCERGHNFVHCAGS